MSRVKSDTFDWSTPEKNIPSIRKSSHCTHSICSPFPLKPTPCNSFSRSIQKPLFYTPDRVTSQLNKLQFSSATETASPTSKQGVIPFDISFTPSPKEEDLTRLRKDSMNPISRDLDLQELEYANGDKKSYEIDPFQIMQQIEEEFLWMESSGGRGYQ